MRRIGALVELASTRLRCAKGCGHAIFWCLPERVLSQMMTPRDRAATTRHAGGALAVLDETGAGTPTARTRSSHGRRRLSPLVAVLAAILLILILPPTLYLVVTS